MKRLHRNGIILLALIAVVGLSAYAFAGPGYGGGRGWGGPGNCPGYGAGYGPGNCPRYGGGNGPGYGYRNDLTEEQLKAIDEERTAFMKNTDGLRQELYSKELELRSELAKENPDAGKAAAIQKEISKLEEQFDQQRIDHMIKMKKIDPQAGAGAMRGKGWHRGPGSRGGGMMGYGQGSGERMMGYGQGPCRQ
jgi:Spy/CpxP family protein refolding chaperone